MKVETKGLVETRDFPQMDCFLTFNLNNWNFLNGEGQKAGVRGVTGAILKSCLLVGFVSPFSKERLTFPLLQADLVRLKHARCMYVVVKCSTRSRDLNTASTDRSTSQTKYLLAECPHSVRKQSCLIKCQLSFPQTRLYIVSPPLNPCVLLVLQHSLPTFSSCSGALSSTSPTFQGWRAFTR